MRIRLILAACLAVALTACGDAPSSSSSSPLAEWRPQGPTRTATLPGGAQIEVELRMTPEEQATGMMFRPQLPPDKGMLFVFDVMEERGFWMFQTKVRLDIIWMDDNKRIVEIAADTPPCGSSNPQNCPSYGGSTPSVYVLEMAGGQAAAYGLKVGDELKF